MPYLFEKLFKLIKAYFIVIGFLVTMLFFLLIAFLSKSLSSVDRPLTPNKSLSDSSLIHIDWTRLNIKPSESEGAGFTILMDELMGNAHGLYIPRFESQLKRMEKDPKVKGLFIELGPIGSNLALLSELRLALLTFKKESGKPIYFWFSRADTRGYYLASVADEILMAPAGHLTLFGPMASNVYFAKALKKLGINVEVIKSGTFKAGFEPFVRNSPSKASLEGYKSLESSILTNLVKDLDGSLKKLDSKKLRKAFKSSIFGHKKALENELITDLAYLYKAKEKYEKKHEAEFYPFKDYLAQLSPDKNKEIKDTGVALIEAVGTIYMSSNDELSITPEKIIKELTWAREEEKVKSVVLRISSGGGDALASDLIWEEIRRLSEEKPLIVSMGSVAASGGYFMAAPAKKIFASPNTITGSIGTISMIGNLKDFEDKYGISFFMHSESDRKKLLDMSQDASDEDKKILRSSAKDTYEDFVKKVALGRGLSIDYVKSIAEGRVWTGSQAKERKLIDAFGGLKEALEEAKTQGGFAKNDKVPVLRWVPEIKSFQDCFRSKDSLRVCFSAGKTSLQNQISLDFFGLKNLDARELKKQLDKKLNLGHTQMICPETLVFENQG